MLGFIIGFLSGALQFWLLAKFIRSILNAGFGPKDVVFGIVSFFVPLLVLVAVAFLSQDWLIPAGCGMAGALISFAAVTFVKRKK